MIYSLIMPYTYSHVGPIYSHHFPYWHIVWEMEKFDAACGAPAIPTAPNIHIYYSVMCFSVMNA